MIGTNRYIGSPVERIEDLRFLRGRGQFVGDLKREGMLHAAILRSPVAHGLIAAVDASAALAIAGVRAVITAKDIGAVPRIPLRLLPLPGTERFLQPVIAADRVRYVGEPVAVVLGDSPALAEDGVGAIAIDIEELPPVPHRHASGRREILLFEEAGTNALRWSLRVSRAMPTRRFATPTTSGATGSQSSAIRPCQWSRAACLPSWLSART
jgi:carbon-monoxide dehydrogenase large subunit